MLTRDQETVLSDLLLNHFSSNLPFLKSVNNVKCNPPIESFFLPPTVLSRPGPLSTPSLPPRAPPPGNILHCVLPRYFSFCQYPSVILLWGRDACGAPENEGVKKENKEKGGKYAPYMGGSVVTPWGQIFYKIWRLETIFHSKEKTERKNNKTETVG